MGRRRTERQEANREGGVEIVAEVVEIIEQKRGEDQGANPKSSWVSMHCYMINMIVPSSEALN